MEFSDTGKQGIFFFEEITSTMDVARNLCRKEPEPVVVAKKQTEGRGRHGRKWISDEGGLWVSVVWANIDQKLLKYIFLVVAVAIIKTLEEFDISARIKIPNDIYIKNRKIAGILIENLEKCVIIGIGVNVNNKIKEKMDEAVSCSDILGYPLNLNSILYILLKNLCSAREQFTKDAEKFLDNARGLLIE